MEQAQSFNDEDMILKLLEENDGFMEIGKLVHSYSRDTRSPKKKYINDCIKGLEDAGLIFKKDKQKVIWAITDEGTKRLHPENFTETETVKEEVPVMANENEGDRNNHY